MFGLLVRVSCFRSFMRLVVLVSLCKVRSVCLMCTCSVFAYNLFSGCGVAFQAYLCDFVLYFVLGVLYVMFMMCNGYVE